MEKSEFAVIASQTMRQIDDLIQRKAKEYSTGDAFSNFKDASGGLSFHDKPEMVAWEFAVKHLQSIKDIISGKVPANDNTIDEKFNDAIVYMLLIKGMLVERNIAQPDVQKTPETEVELVSMKFKQQGN